MLKVLSGQEKIVFVVPRRHFASFQLHIQQLAAAQPNVTRRVKGASLPSAAVSEACIRAKTYLLGLSERDMRQFEVKAHVVKAGMMLMLPAKSWHWGFVSI